MKTIIILILTVLFFWTYTANGQSNEEWGSDSPFGPYEEPEYDPANDSPWSKTENMFNSTTPMTPPPPPTPGVPIDGGAGFLLAAGVGYGLREIRKRRKKEN